MSAHVDEIELRRAPRIKAEDVFQAADALLVDGHRPTIDRVRMKLGRGSPNTINEHLDTWWSNVGARLRDLPGQMLPGLPETVTTSLLQLWNLALRESHTALRTSLEAREVALATATTKLEQRAAGFDDHVRTLEDTHAALECARAAAQTQLEEANQRARTLEATLQRRDHEAADQRQALLKAEQDAVRLHRTLEDERRARTAERSRLDERYDALQARGSQEIDRLRQALKEEQKLTRDQRLRLDKLLADNEQVRTTTAQARAELEKAVRQRDQLAARLRQTDRRPGAKPPTKRKRSPKAV